MRSRLSSLPPGPRPTPGENDRRAGVLVPLFVRDAKLWVLFTRRTESVEHHRGQISFPGGGEESEDDSLYETALRETEEELGIARRDVVSLGSLSPIVTVTNFYVEPYVAAVPQPYVWQPAEAEIAEVIEAPLPSLMDPAIRESQPIPGREGVILFYHYGKHVIWGATARILAELLEALGGPPAR
ncbi:MAG TPA: CoA pyrophosphatase [Thermoanaerobaculia bacterium]|nr:CoA pyrophosphatase [Thermoanaerobaculia bacterium]